MKMNLPLFKLEERKGAGDTPKILEAGQKCSAKIESNGLGKVSSFQRTFATLKISRDWIGVFSYMLVILIIFSISQTASANQESSNRADQILKQLHGNIGTTDERVALLFNLVQKEDFSVIKVVLDDAFTPITGLRNEKEESFMHVAVGRGDFNLVEYLVFEHDFSEELKEAAFTLVLIEKCMQDIHQVPVDLFHEKLKILTLLFHHKPKLIEFEMSGLELTPTPLHFAVQRTFKNGMQLELIKFLIEQGADVNAVDENENTALHLAFTLPESKEDVTCKVVGDEESSLDQEENNLLLVNVTQLLIKNGADPNALSHCGRTFLHIAAASLDPVSFHDLFVYFIKLPNARLSSITSAQGYERTTVLHEAVYTFDVLFETLEIAYIITGVDFNAVDKDGDSVFFYAVWGGRDEQFLSNLIKFGADWKVRNDKQETALHMAVSYGNLPAVKLLIALGSYVNAKGVEGQTPLMTPFYPCETMPHNTLELVKELLKHGADPTITSSRGQSSISMATTKVEKGEVDKAVLDLLENAEKMNKETISEKDRAAQLLKQLNGDIGTDDRVALLFKLIQKENFNVIKGALEETFTSITELRNEEEQHMLHVAVNRGEFPLVEYLVLKDDFPEKLKEAAFTLGLLEKCMQDIHQVPADLFHEKLKILTLLFSHKPELIEFEMSGLERNTTPLHFAAEQNFINGMQLELVQYLIKQGADVNAVDENGNTALHLGVFHPDVIRLLIENGADPNVLNHYDRTFIHVAAANLGPVSFHDLFLYFIKLPNVKMSSITSVQGIERTTVLHEAVYTFDVLFETLVIASGIESVDFNAVDKDGDSVFFYAVWGGRDEQFLNNLIKFGADWSSRNKNKETALHYAVAYGNLPAVKLLLGLGSYVNAKAGGGQVPLAAPFTLCETPPHNTLELVKELLKNGADPTIEEDSGYSPISLAQSKFQNGEIDQAVVDLLLEKAKQTNSIEL